MRQMSYSLPRIDVTLTSEYLLLIVLRLEYTLMLMKPNARRS